MAEYLTMRVPDASRQVRFHQLLVAARKTWLLDALSEALGRVGPEELKRQLTACVPGDAQQILAAAGVRDEHVFPTPIVLEAAPTLVGYYRLLLGSPQKSFYRSGTGLSMFKKMEMKGLAGEREKAALPQFCAAMCQSLAELVRQLSPRISPRDVVELPLVTLGSYFQGSLNVSIGKQATVDVFLAIAEIVKDAIESRSENRLVVRNAAGRHVRLSLSHDPDVKIEEEFSGEWRKKVAIEIKGGTDKSNAHNRAGEAEKSHIKAREQDFRDFWTLIAKKGLDMERLQVESPSTASWFDVAEVLAREGEDWEQFRSRIADAVGIPLA